jgi:type IV secretory pathway TraG/TraD family ATPase VirD4
MGTLDLTEVCTLLDISLDCAIQLPDIPYLDQISPLMDAVPWYVYAPIFLVLLLLFWSLISRFYLVFVRIGDILDLIWSNLTTLGGIIRFVSVDELVNRRKPANFMRLVERKNLINQFHSGFLLDGKVGRFSRKTSFRAMITVGGMGVGKSANLIMPNILTADHCSLVISDPSGEIYEQTSGYLANRGYDIQVLNLIDPGRSHRYNPLVSVESYADAEKISYLLASTSSGGKSQEPIWDNGAQRLMRILILALKNTEHADEVTLSDLLYWINAFDAHRTGGRLTGFIAANTENDEAVYQDFAGFIHATPEKMLLSFVATAQTTLRLVGNPDIAQLISGHDFDFSAMKTRKTALYVLVREQDMGAFGFLLTLFYSELLNALLQDRRGQIPVYLMLDEFGHLNIPGFESFATTARKFKVGFWLILQSLAQLEKHYGAQGARTILDDVGTESWTPRKTSPFWRDDVILFR